MGLRRQMRQKIDVSDKVHQDFKQLYKAEIEPTIDQRMAEGVQKIKKDKIVGLPYVMKIEENDSESSSQMTRVAQEFFLSRKSLAG